MPSAAYLEKRAMQPADPIGEYGAAIARELSFDARLARRARGGRGSSAGALAASDSPTSREAREGTVAAFGDACELARAFVPDALQSLARRTTVLLALAVIGIFTAMNGRVAWYAWRRAPPRHHAAYGHEIRRCIGLSAMTLIVLFAAVVTEHWRCGLPARIRRLRLHSLPESSPKCLRPRAMISGSVG
jgi:hypothetical protein